MIYIIFTILKKFSIENFLLVKMGKTIHMGFIGIVNEEGRERIR